MSFADALKKSPPGSSPVGDMEVVSEVCGLLLSVDSEVHVVHTENYVVVLIGVLKWSVCACGCIHGVLSLRVGLHSSS